MHLGTSALVATAIHDGHELRPSLRNKLALIDEGRLREEDPHTGQWLRLTDTWVLVHRSRFEVDLNRPRERAVYRGPEEAWGLRVWSEPLSAEDVAESLALYDDFYADLGRLLAGVCERHGGFVLYDLHSYNHRREGPSAPPTPPHLAPEINVGTGSLDRRRWGHVVERFVEVLRGARIDGRRLDVRENVNFRGGELSRWVHAHFGDRGCALAIEVKKFFMDEWSGRVDVRALDAVGDALFATVAPVLAARRAPPTVFASAVRP